MTVEYSKAYHEQNFILLDYIQLLLRSAALYFIRMTLCRAEYELFNYFTEISFYLETSILLPNNSYDSPDETRIRQIREGSLPVLAPERQP